MSTGSRLGNALVYFDIQAGRAKVSQTSGEFVRQPKFPPKQEACFGKH